MSQLHAITTDVPTAPPPGKGRPLLAWLIICAAIAFILWRSQTVVPEDRQRYDLVSMRLQGRYMVGMGEVEKRFVSGKSSSREMLYQRERTLLNRGSYAQRLRFVVLAGEMKGPEEAREQLRQINRKYREHCGEPPAKEAETSQILDRLYTDRPQGPKAASILVKDEQQELRQQLDWFGELALAPPGSDPTAREAVLAPAYRTVWTVVSGVVFMLGMGAAGLVLIVTLIVLYFLDRLHGGIRPLVPHHGIYAETFALYMVLFLGLSVGAHYASSWLSLDQGALVISGLAALGSLAALAWPVLRGIPWRQVRQDIGWHRDREPRLEPLLGLGCYVMAVPMLALGVGTFLLLTKLRDLLGWGPDEFGPSNMPGHPIVFWVGQAGWWVWLEILFVACVVAPIVEETMFRGVLYRHLRAATSCWRPIMSVLGSAVTVSFVFAVIHPQGFLAIPLLMALALAFALMREWRGTVLPSMIAHGLNNAVATALLFLLS